MNFQLDELRNLWPQLDAAANKRLAIAGGFGLWLQQNYLVAECKKPIGPRILVPFEKWVNSKEIRTTNDLDLLLDLEIIAVAEMQQALAGILIGEGYRHLTDSDRRWKFSKEEGDKSFKVEFLSEVPDDNDPRGFRTDERRVRNRQSVKDGLHGRATPESRFWHQHPFEFIWDGLTVRTPNALSWVNMKIFATRDSLEKMRTDEDNADRFRSLAIKHGRDCYRIMAMLDSERFHHTLDLASKIPEMRVEAGTIFTEVFLNPGVIQFACREDWDPSMMDLLEDTLAKLLKAA